MESSPYVSANYRESQPRRFLGQVLRACILLAFLGSLCAAGAELDAGAIQSLKSELEDLRQRTQLLEDKIKALEGTTNRNGASQAVSQAIPAPQESPATNADIAPKKWTPAQPLNVFRAGSSYMNISFDATVNAGGSTQSDVSKELQLGDHDPSQRGVSLRNAEISMDGAVDPYFKGFANTVLKLDPDNATEIELEEAYLQTISLPGNLQLKAGQFFAEFGRQNLQHPHQWAFVDQPLVLNRLFGPDGLRNPGARISWLAPTPFYTEAFLGVFNGQGGTAFSYRDPSTEGVHGRTPLGRNLRGAGDLLYVPRVSSSFEIADTQTLVVGASGAFGPNNSGPQSRTEIYGADAYWKWKPRNADQGFPFVSWQNEWLIRRYGAGADPTVPLPAETLRDWGVYSQLLWGFKPHWVAGLRGEYVGGNSGAYDSADVFRTERTRFSPALTWYPSEFSKVRLQYNLDQGDRFNVAHSVWLQLEFLLGAHGAHRF